MSFSRSKGGILTIIAVFMLAACGDSNGSGSAATGAAGQGRTDGLFKPGALYLVIDFERREFNLQQGPVALWTLPFVTTDTTDVADWLEAFEQDPQGAGTPLSENILLRSRSQLSDSVMAIVAEASGFDAHLLERRIPARFILRWEDAALEIESPVEASGTSVGEVWQDARSTAFRLFGEERLKVQVDSMGALTLQRAAKPPILTIVRPPRKR